MHMKSFNLRTLNWYLTPVWFRCSVGLLIAAVMSSVGTRTFLVLVLEMAGKRNEVRPTIIWITTGTLVLMNRRPSTANSEVGLQLNFVVEIKKLSDRKIVLDRAFCVNGVYIWSFEMLQVVTDWTHRNSATVSEFWISSFNSALLRLSNCNFPDCFLLSFLSFISSGSS